MGRWRDGVGVGAAGGGAKGLEVVTGWHQHVGAQEVVCKLSHVDEIHHLVVCGAHKRGWADVSVGSRVNMYVQYLSRVAAYDNGNIRMMEGDHG